MLRDADDSSVYCFHREATATVKDTLISEISLNGPHRPAFLFYLIVQQQTQRCKLAAGRLTLRRAENLSSQLSEQITIVTVAIRHAYSEVTLFGEDFERLYMLHLTTDQFIALLLLLLIS